MVGSAGKGKSSSAGKGKSSRQPRHSTRSEPTGRFLNRGCWEALGKGSPPALGKGSPPVNRDTRHGGNLRVQASEAWPGGTFFPTVFQWLTFIPNIFTSLKSLASFKRWHFFSQRFFQRLTFIPNIFTNLKSLVSLKGDAFFPTISGTQESGSLPEGPV